MLTENKVSKYFLYAIGEIVLVVIGILIALSINNWNEERKLKAAEKEVLANLSVSFERKLNELEDKNAGRSENINGINRLLKIISKQDPSGSDAEMFDVLQDLFTWYAVNEEFSVINALYSSGKINLISNDSLKTKLIAWPDMMEEMLEEQRVLQDLVIHKLNPLISNYVPSRNLANSWEIDGPGITSAESPYPNDFIGLLKDKDFENLIVQKKLYLYANVVDTKPLIESAKSILKLIELELKNK